MFHQAKIWFAIRNRLRLVRFPKPRLVTCLIIAACVLGYCLLLTNPSLANTFALWPMSAAPFNALPSFHSWQLVTYGFLHLMGTMAHLLMNIYAIYLFGSDVERVLKPLRFTVYYLVCIIGAAMLQLAYMRIMNASAMYVLGASGGVYGLLLAYGYFFPRRQFVVLGVSAKTALVGFGLIELMLGLLYSKPSSAHFAHLGGMAAGYGLIRYWRRRPT